MLVELFIHYTQKDIAASQSFEIGKKISSVICGKVLEELQQKLGQSTNYFTSYKQIHQ